MNLTLDGTGGVRAECCSPTHDTRARKGIQWSWEETFSKRTCRDPSQDCCQQGQRLTYGRISMSNSTQLSVASARALPGMWWGPGHILDTSRYIWADSRQPQ